ncbi:MAG: YigZ family protein [Ruminiclostridium sp.]|nr:YigZ family protein [Ruminiclostridium sp.]
MAEEYKTIADKATASFIEKKSEFIGNIAPAKTEEEAIAFIEEIRKQHRKATHNCYAYILRNNNIGRHSDDGEPSGTAGAPMFEVLKKEGLTDVCCVVTRYFGGILLGAGGLVRAYGNGVKIAVDAAKIKLINTARRLMFTIDYSLYGKIDALLAEYDVRVQNEDFGADIKITLCIRDERAAEFREKLTDLCNGRIVIDDAGIEEFDFAQ